eukprot:3182503-Amphidinium_carterae.1
MTGSLSEVRCMLGLESAGCWVTTVVTLLCLSVSFVCWVKVAGWRSGSSEKHKGTRKTLPPWWWNGENMVRLLKEARPTQSKWQIFMSEETYLASLPTRFDSPLYNKPYYVTEAALDQAVSEVVETMSSDKAKISYMSA